MLHSVHALGPYAAAALTLSRCRVPWGWWVLTLTILARLQTSAYLRWSWRIVAAVAVVIPKVQWTARIAASACVPAGAPGVDDARGRGCAPTHAHSPHQACSRASSTWPSARDACWRGKPRRVMVPSSPNHRRASVGPGVVRSWRSLGARSPSTTPRCQVNSLGERSAVLWVFQQVEVDEHAKAQVCAGTRTSQGQ